MTYVVGIDEAGRGPLAGPVAVGAVRTGAGFDRRFFSGIRDSKQLTEAKREEWFQRAKEARREGRLDFAVALVSERVIDRRGLVYAIRLGIRRCLERLNVEAQEARIILDGSLSAPKRFRHQETIIRGDETEPIISLASVCAKVTRDRRMVRLSQKYPQYGFHLHKGYGTRAHREAIGKYGPSAIHRRSFLNGLT